MNTADTLRLQPPPPQRYRGPTVVEPRWSLAGTAGELLRGDVAGRLTARLCEIYGAKHCLLLDRARTGLYLLIEGLQLRGHWVMPSFMHRPTAVLLKNQAARVTLADMDNEFNLSVDAARAALSPQTQAVLVTHTYGKTADIAGLRALADRQRLFLVENAVHAAPWLDVGGRRVGSLGDATMLSFNVDKPFGALLGGALLTSRDDVWQAVSALPLAAPSGREVRDRLRATFAAYRLKPWLLRLPGVAARYARALDGVAEIGSFSAGEYRKFTARRMHPLQGAASLDALRTLRERVENRRQAARRLAAALSGIAGLELPQDTPQAPHGFLYFPVVLPAGRDRFEVGCRLARDGFETKWRYHPLHLQPDLALATAGTLATTEDYWRRHLCLPAGDDPHSPHLDALAASLRAALAA